ncbi:hypothetical protein D4R42_05500 [bacterium]|nr:MAG: hypothetical protein D4R42_05500 [bacterium]
MKEAIEKQVRTEMLKKLNKYQAQIITLAFEYDENKITFEEVIEETKDIPIEHMKNLNRSKLRQETINEMLFREIDELKKRAENLES